MQQGNPKFFFGAWENQSKVTGCRQNKESISKMVDMNTKPGEVYIGSVMAEYPGTGKRKKKGKGNREKNI